MHDKTGESVTCRSHISIIGDLHIGRVSYWIFLLRGDFKYAKPHSFLYLDR